MNMRIVERFPREIQMFDDVSIPLSDGTKLAARIWRPVDAEADPVPAILEYLPYRRRDGTAERDFTTHPYFAGHGYAAVRVDIRGTGDSDGVILGEYLKQEQDDGLEIIAWIAAQPWCTGKVGMIGISWGGFNGLQIAALPSAGPEGHSLHRLDRRPLCRRHPRHGRLPADRQAGLGLDHLLHQLGPAGSGHRGGALARDVAGAPGQGRFLGLAEWMRHQRRDALYKHGSVAEDWEAIQCPVYAVGGWTDGYTNAVFRLLANLKSPSKGLVGPWAHKYPHFALPGPAIGFLQECLRWWDHWLKGRDTGIMAEPKLRVWLEDPAPPLSHHDYKAGRWVAEESWPSPRLGERRWRLERGLLSEGASVAAGEGLPISSPQTWGPTCGLLVPPMASAGDQPIDQRPEARRLHSSSIPHPWRRTSRCWARPWSSSTSRPTGRTRFSPAPSPRSCPMAPSPA